MLTGLDHFFGPDPAELLQRPIPVNDPVVSSDHKSGNGGTPDDAVQGLLAVLEEFIRPLAFVFRCFEGPVVRVMFLFHSVAPRKNRSCMPEPDMIKILAIEAPDRNPQEQITSVNHGADSKLRTDETIEKQPHPVKHKA